MARLKRVHSPRGLPAVVASPWVRPGGYAIALLASLCMAPAPSASAQDFYAGKTLTIVVGSSTGGGYDLNARLLARHIGNHIPGRPNVVVQNMPGAGSLTSVRYVANSAPRDGTVMVAFQFGLIGQSRLTPELVPLDFRKFAWIGSISDDYAVCYVWHTVPFDSISELKAKNAPMLHFGMSGAGTNSDVYTRILKFVFKVNVQTVRGYPGSTETRLAIDRGEVDGGCGAWSSVPEDWIAQKLIKPLYRSGINVPPDMPAGVPHMMELAATDRDRSIIRVLVTDRELGRPYVVSTEVPKDRLAILRKAFDETMTDKRFLAEAEKLRQPVAPKNADEALNTVNAIYAVPDDIVAAARAIMTQ